MIDTPLPKPRPTATEGWLAAILFVLVITIYCFWCNHLAYQQVRQVRSFWTDDGSLRFSTSRGGVVVSHLQYYNPGGGVHGATLKYPRFILGSNPAVITAEEFKQLEWYTEGGLPVPDPPLGSKIIGLYIRLQETEVYP